MDFNKIRINHKRFKHNFDTLAQIGSTGDGGVHRPTFSPAHLEARNWFKNQVEAVGFDFRMDGAGNQSAFLPSDFGNVPTLILGSHLDSVPYGGMFDGALGVVAALEVLQRIQEFGLSLPFNLEAIDFTDEEGTLVGLMGSSALSGRLKESDLLEPRGGRQALLDGLKHAGLSETHIFTAARDAHVLAGYLELHIEQGSRLLESQKSAGVVSSIVGIESYRVIFIGDANHAGTTSMQSRRDASQGASAFTLGVRQLILQRFPECVANIGNMEFRPGAFNIIPGQVAVSLEFRAPNTDLFEQLEVALLKLAHEEADQFGLEIETEFLGKHTPTPMSPAVQTMIVRAAETLELETMSLPSGAGHDAQSFADLCPVGMIFVPSEKGISHSPKEFTKWQDCINGANLLLQTTLEWIDQHQNQG